MSPSLGERRRLFAAQQSSVLIITLFFVALITIIIAGFLTNMRIEKTTARSHLNGVLAGLYAEAGIDTALTRLHGVMGDTNRFWTTEGGRIYASNAGTNAFVTNVVDLSSGPWTNAAAPSSQDQGVDLNPPTLENSTVNLVTSSTLPMYLHWIYQHQSGQLDTAAPPTFNSNDPVIGRFAFWVDDESAKINLNTAWAREGANTNGQTHPSRVNLQAITSLPSADVDQINAYRGADNYFNSLNEARQVNADVNTAVTNNAFALTAYNHSPELNMFGEPRILLTTQKTNADLCGTTNFLDILATANTDPGNLSALDTTKLGTVYTKIVNELNRTNWPFLEGQSFVSKYANQTDTGQIALNIIDYVRSAESTNDIVEPLRGKISGNTFALTASGTRMGVARQPYITEYGIFPVGAPVQNTGNTNYNFFVTMAVKVSLPPNYGLKQLDLTQLYYDCNLWQGTSSANLAVTGVTGTQITAAMSSSGQFLQAGHSTTITYTARVITYPFSAAPVSVTFQPVLRDYPNKISIDPVDLSGAGLNRAADPVGTSTTTMSSWAVNDPRVQAVDPDWQKTSPNSFSGTLPYGPPGICQTNQTPLAANVPPQDTTTAFNFSTAKTTDAGMHMPAPKATSPADVNALTTNPLGMVYSVGELGYIHTGVDSKNSTSGTYTGMAWRTVRLQPDPTSSTTLPDWAMLDLFSTPIAAAQVDTPFVFPGNASANTYINSGGKVNVNAGIAPFTNAASSSPLYSRVLPLQGLLLGASLTGTTTVSTSSTPSLSSLVTAITNQTLATGGRTYGTQPGFYYHPAQLAEVQGVADSGEASEALVREIAAQGAVRGDVFSIYSIGQSLKQDATGIHVLAERREQKIFERVCTGGTVAFQPVFSKDIEP
jgi:hypothetical protein